MERTASSVWENCLKYINQNISDQVYNTWFRPIVPVNLEGNVLTLQVPSPFFYEWLEGNYVTEIRNAISMTLGSGAKLKYTTPSNNVIQENTDTNTSNLNQPTQVKFAQNRPQQPKQAGFNNQTNEGSGIINPFALPSARKINIDPQLNPNYSFDAFIVGDSNKLAKSAGNAVGKNPGGTAFNPLFLYGGVGLGKTHIANAIGLKVKENFPDKAVLYVSAEKFTQQYTEAHRKNTRNDFINFYQMIDVLIIDDVQFFSSKEGTQNAFFQIFNHLHQKGKQLILTSDKAPVDMQGFENRLLSRFKWGLSAEVNSPNYDTRVEIIKSRNEKDGTDMPEDVLNYLANNVTTNVRELEGVLISLLAHSSFNQEGLTVELSKKVVNKFIKTTTKEISIDYIQKTICSYFDVDMEQLQSKSRKRNIVQARQVAMYFAKKHTKASLALIGAEIGKRDHATVLHACKTIGNLKETDKKFRDHISTINKKFAAV